MSCLPSFRACGGKIAPSVPLRPVLPSENELTKCQITPQDLPLRSLIVIPAHIPPTEEEYPPGWAECTTPDGRSYSWHEAQQIIIPADIRQYSSKVQGLGIHEWLLRAVGEHRDLRDCEVFINPASADGVLEYYFIDRTSRRLFWLETVTDDFGKALSNVSISDAEYWAHVASFPVHRRVDDRDEDELLAILDRGCSEDIHPKDSTLPYSASECRRYVKILRMCRSIDGRAGYRTASFAHIWSTIARSRRSRLSDGFKSCDFLGPLAQSSPGLWMRVAEFLSFHVPRETLRQILALRNKQFASHYRCGGYSDAMHRDWRRMGVLGGLLLLVTGTQLLKGESNLPLVAAAFCAAISVLSAECLIRSYSTDKLNGDLDTQDIYVLQGLRPLALLFSTPRTVTTYAALFLLNGIMRRGVINITQPGSTLLLIAAWCLPFFTTS